MLIIYHPIPGVGVVSVGGGNIVIIMLPQSSLTQLELGLSLAIQNLINRDTTTSIEQ